MCGQMLLPAEAGMQYHEFARVGVCCRVFAPQGFCARRAGSAGRALQFGLNIGDLLCATRPTQNHPQGELNPQMGQHASRAATGQY